MKTILLPFFLCASFFVMAQEPVKLRPLCNLMAYHPKKIHAVIVGISTYKYGGIYLNNLSTCDNDATEFDKFLLTQSADEDKAGWVDYLVNENATEENVVHSLEMMSKLSQPEDVAIFFFSGHGAKGGLTHYNTDDSDIMEYEGIKYMLRNCPAQQKIVILDACHAGSSTDAIYMGAVSDILNASYNKGMCLISSSKADESSLEYSEVGMGYFTYYFMEALGGNGDLNEDGCITIEEAFLYTKLNVVLATEGAQTPTLSGEIPENFILWSK